MLWSNLIKKFVARIMICDRTGHTTFDWYDQQYECDWYDHCEKLEVEPDDLLEELFENMEPV